MDITATAIIIGLIDVAKRQFPQVTGLLTVGLAVVLGAALGYLQLLGVDTLENGIIAGLSAVGVITTATRISK